MSSFITRKKSDVSTKSHVELVIRDLFDIYFNVILFHMIFSADRHLRFY